MVRKASNVERSKQKDTKEDPVDQKTEEADISASGSHGISKSPIKVSVTVTQNNEAEEEDFSPQTEADEGEENKKADTPDFKDKGSKSVKTSKNTAMNGTPIKYNGTELAKEAEEVEKLCLEGSKMKDSCSQASRSVNIGVQIGEDTSNKSKNLTTLDEQVQVIINIGKSSASKHQSAASPMKSKGEKSPLGKSYGKKTPPPLEDIKESKKVNSGSSKVDIGID